MDKVEIMIVGPATWNSLNDNVDVEVKFSNGSRWTATFFTIENIRSIFEKNKETGECSSGLYLWASDMVIVENMTRGVIEETVQDLLREGEFKKAFSRLPDVVG